MAKNEQAKCWKCGEPLNEDNCRTSDSHSGFAFMCVECENAWLLETAKLQGIYEALYSACIAFDVPCIPKVLDGVELNDLDNPWQTYLDLLDEQGEYIVNGKVRGFKDGYKTIFSLFGGDLTHKDFGERIKRDLAKVKKGQEKKAQQIGTDEQIAKWGKLSIYKGLNWSQDLYDELDRIHETRASAYKGVDLNGQQQAILVKVAKNDAIYDHLMRTGLAKLATDIQKSTSQLLADENMRPKDKKPVEELRLDALVLALEEAGLMENGDLLNYDELIEVLRDRFVKSKKYNYSLDIADQMILDVINSMRYNADLPYIQDLPEEFAPVDEYGEFEPEETEREKENKRFLGITKVNIVKSDKGDN